MKQKGIVRQLTKSNLDKKGVNKTGKILNEQKMSYGLTLMGKSRNGMLG